MDFPAQRRERLARQLDTEGVDAFLISSPVNVSYLSGFSGDSSMLVVEREGALLVSDARYTQQIAEECRGLDTHIRKTSESIDEAVASVLGKKSIRSVGYESNSLTVADFQKLQSDVKNLEWKGGSGRVEKLRMVKDVSEIEEIREAIRIAERAFIVFRTFLQREDCEKNLHDAMEGYIRRVGGKETSFPTIVAVGDRSALPHAPPTLRTVKEGDMLLLDWGACGKRYMSDLTRVFALGSLSTKFEEIYKVVLNAQEKAIAAVRPGVEAREIDAVARGAIADAGYGEAFGHGLGHGIGLQIHEGPSIRPRSTTKLEQGMVFTIEPGIYLPGWGGIRIEDDILVTSSGCEVLTTVPKDLDSLVLFEN